MQDILLTYNIWKHLSWTHFYNLVASIRRVQQPKTFVMLSGFWSLRGCGGGGLSEYIKICGENVAVANKFLNNLEYSVKTEGIIVCNGFSRPPFKVPTP